LKILICKKLKKLSSEQYKQIGEALGKNTHLQELVWEIHTADKEYCPKDSWPRQIHFEVFPNFIETNSALKTLFFSVLFFCSPLHFLFIMRE